MEKFLKSLFHPTDKKPPRGGDREWEEERGDVPPLDGRRKLSVSRSGRMRQNKKRHSLNTELYGESFQAVEKPTSTEYHVHGRTYTNSNNNNNNNNNNNSSGSRDTRPASRDTDSARREKQLKSPERRDEMQVKSSERREERQVKPPERKEERQMKSPEEEIDSAFQIIDNT